MDISHQYRRRALAATEALIVQAERLRDAQTLVLKSQTAAGQNIDRSAMLLKLTEQRLTKLQASRRHLVEVESTEAAPPEA